MEGLGRLQLGQVEDDLRNLMIITSLLQVVRLNVDRFDDGIVGAHIDISLVAASGRWRWRSVGLIRLDGGSRNGPPSVAPDIGIVGEVWAQMRRWTIRLNGRRLDGLLYMEGASGRASTERAAETLVLERVEGLLLLRWTVAGLWEMGLVLLLLLVLVLWWWSVVGRRTREAERGLDLVEEGRFRVVLMMMMLVLVLLRWTMEVRLLLELRPELGRPVLNVHFWRTVLQDGHAIVGSRRRDVWRWRRILGYGTCRHAIDRRWQVKVLRQLRRRSVRVPNRSFAPLSLVLIDDSPRI